MPKPRAEPWGKDGEGKDGEGKNESAASAAEKLRQFNRKFYQEFRQNAAQGAADENKPKYKQAAGGGKAQAPSKPLGLRFTHRDDTTITLVWDNSEVVKGDNSNVAYELQWRVRSKSLTEWKTSPTLIVSQSCRKKNLTVGTTYEFRVRAASAFGWSGYSEGVSVMTCTCASEANISLLRAHLSCERISFASTAVLAHLAYSRSP